MNLKQIKIQCLKRNISMTELAEELNISRTWLYNRIKRKDTKLIKKIQNFFNSSVIKW